MTDRFDWGQLTQDWWLTTAKTIGANERHAKFAAAKFRGCTNTEAARQSGFAPGGSEGSIRSEGYRLARANKIVQLLSLASAECGGGIDGCVTSAEAKQILSHLARGSDPSVRIKALDSLAKMQERDDAASRPDEPSLEDSLYAVINALPESGLGAAFALGTFFNATGNVINFKFLSEVAPIVAKNFPTEWARFCSKHPRGDWAADFLNKMAAGECLEGEALVAVVKAKMPTRFVAPVKPTEEANASQ
jgi:hypothetical protein